jgi:hypothetical protein
MAGQRNMATQEFHYYQAENLTLVSHETLRRTHYRNAEGMTMAGEAVYTKAMLSIYDEVVLGFSLRWIWDCSSRHLLDFYNEHVGASHMDVGVGTGYFLDKCRFPCWKPTIMLLDLNPNCLKRAAGRLMRYCPQQLLADILEPLPHELGQFDSIGLSLLLHCLSGTMATKTQIFGRLKPSLKKGGTLFGVTVLGRGIRLSRLALSVTKLYNAFGIFSNLSDDQVGLEAGLARHFPIYRVYTQGCLAFFVGKA